MFYLTWLSRFLIAASSLIMCICPFGAGFAELPSSGAVLRVGLEARPRSVDPRYVSTDANSQYLEPLLFLPLVGFSYTGAPQEVVAESVKVVDPLTLLVRVREGIRFASGRELDAEDVVATYNFVRFGASGTPTSPRRGVFERIKTIEKLSKRELRFTLHEPDVSLISNLVVGILPKEAIIRSPDEIIGLGFESGPFLLARSQDDEWVLTRNTQYTGAPFGGELPSLEKVIFRIFPDNNTRYAALLKGDLDLVQNSLDSDKVVEFKNKQSDEFEVQLQTADSTAFLAFNLRYKLFADVRVRRAVALAINRAEVLKFTLQGLGHEANSMFPPGHPFHFEDKSPPLFNLREAETLLDAAGLFDPDGSKGPKPRASFNIKVPLNRERIAVAKAIAGQLKKVGLKVAVEVLEFNTFMKHLNNGNVQSWIAPWTGYKDGDHLHFVFHSKRVPPHGANRGFYSNSKLDEILDAAKSESSFDARRALYSRAQSIIASDFPYVFLWHRIGHSILSKKFGGFKLYPDGRYASLTRVNRK